MENKLIDFFIEQNALTSDHLSILQNAKKENNKPLHEIAIDLEFIEKEESLRLSALFFKIPYIHLNHYSLTPFEDLNDSLKDLKSCIFKEDETTIHIGLEDPLDLLLKDAIKQDLFKKGYDKKHIEWYFTNLDVKEKPFSSLDQTLLGELNELFEKSVYLKATDIHLKPKEATFCCYFRINGDLILQKTWGKSEQTILINRLKILSNLDIAQTRTPQSGMFVQKIDNRNIHYRVSTHPTRNGEAIAIRILDLFKKRLNLDELGICESHLDALKKTLLLKEGLILLTGPTGSGKTTTLYACLDFLKDQNLNIMTLEDPIECQMDFVTQTEISHSFSYENGIKSILRQDPDVILIGEIRDEKTAQMAFRAAMTGHLVLSTLHTQSVETIIDRLYDLTISHHLIKTFLKLGMQQTFIKKMPETYEDENDQIYYKNKSFTRILKTEVKTF
ncbi:MAG: Flp pilus assembly complex ATPase component TadA [Proteobacteria bacterium]|nr:Flp pilus assembly complex ATPase component TadA [Pseudomonadota bacterium]